MTHSDNELRRTLWELADDWDGRAGPGEAMLREFIKELRAALTYPMADEADEAALQAAYGKTSDELADEAERGWPVEPPLSPADRSFDERGMSL